MNRKNAFVEMKSSLKYLVQSIQGKYSLETYLEVLSEFTDSEISSSEEKGLKFVGGEVVFCTEDDCSSIEVDIKLEFQESNGEWKLKTAERTLSKNMFIQESIELLNREKSIKYEVENPIR